MATYKEIKGTDITVVSSDPSNPVTGEVWYNTTTQQLKGYQQVLGNAWSTGGNLNTARHNLKGAGTQTAGLAFGGGHTVVTALTEQYDGSSWTEVADLNTARSSLGGDGTQTSALAFGGQPVTAVTESWNGSSWTEVADLNTARRSAVGSGTTSAGLAFGGEAPPNTAATEEWFGDGTLSENID